jgi:hypothetical protein
MTNFSSCSKSAPSRKLLLELWASFNVKFRTSEDCIEALCRRHAMRECRRCGSSKVYKRYGARLLQCKNCKRESWRTAGTFFQYMKVPRAWLAAIWFMEHGCMINASILSKLVCIAYSSALNILKKLMIVIENHMHENTISVPSAVFLSVVAKRSRETRARAHPQTEIEDANRQAHMEDEDTHGEAKRGELSADDREELSIQEREIYDALSLDPIQFDSLCERIEMPVAELSAHLTMLEIKGFVERMAGDRYTKISAHRSIKSSMFADVTPSKVDTLQATVNEIIAFVRLTYHSVSRKYLQNYLAAYWCGKDRVKWNIGSLLQSCHRIPHITDSEILNYVSPNLLKIIVATTHCNSFKSL